MRRWTPAGLLAFLGLAVPTAARAQPDRTPEDSLAIAAAGRAFSDAYVRNDTTALGRLYSDSAVVLPPNREIRGRAAIRRYFSWRAPYRQLAHAMTSERLTVAGDLAIDLGTWSSTGQRGDDPPQTTSERYLIVWVREHDGAWRILYDMWHRPAP
jgi:ketosteroid isomerase-like protein